MARKCSAFVLQLLGALIFSSEIASCTVQSVELTSHSSVQDGVSVTELHGLIDTNFDEWLLNSTSWSSSSEWSLLLGLDQSWALDASSSSISVTLNGYAVTDNVALELAFKVNDNYINTQIYLNNEQNNEISPSCFQSTTSAPPTMNSGNISKLTTQTHDTLLPTQHKSKGGAPKGYDNEFPLTFTISQISNNYTKISYHSSSWTNFEQYCVFTPFDLHSGLEIYISSHGAAQEVAITSIEVTRISTANGVQSMATTTSPDTASSTEMSVADPDTELLSKGATDDTMDVSYIQIVINVVVTLFTVFCCCSLLLIVYCFCGHRFRPKPRLGTVASNSIMSPKLPPPPSHHLEASAEPTTATDHELQEVDTQSTVSPPQSFVRVNHGNRTLTATTVTTEDVLGRQLTAIDVDQEPTVNLSTMAEAQSSPDDDDDDDDADDEEQLDLDEDESKLYDSRIRLAADRRIDKSMNRMLHISNMHSLDMSKLRASPEASMYAGCDQVCVAMVSLDELKEMNENHVQAGRHMYYASHTIQTGDDGSPSFDIDDSVPPVQLGEPGAFPGITS